MDWDKLIIGNYLTGDTGNLSWGSRNPRVQKFGIPGTNCTVAINYVTVDETNKTRPPRPMHSHEYEQIMLITEGDGEFVIEGRHFPASAGSYAVIPPNVMHKFDSSTSTKNIVNIDIFTPPRDEFVFYKEDKAKDTE